MRGYLGYGGQSSVDTETLPATHQWQVSRFTATVTCSVCGLLPLDEDDTNSECEGKS